jgi:signal transduction histidine kinase
MRLPKLSPKSIGSLARTSRATSRKVDEDLPLRFVESLGLLGHELRNPLHCILTATALTQRWSALSEENRRLLAIIDRAARRMRHIVATTLDCAQAVSRPLVVAPQRIDLLAICQDVVEETLAAHPVVVRLEASDAQWGWWDPVGIAQVLTNLIGNAIVHGARDQPITVKLTDGSSAVRVTVANKGPVIPPEMLSSIFEPWRRGSGTAQWGQQSLGLGLHVVRRLVDAHRGTVTVASSAEDGTSFVVHLPR